MEAVACRGLQLGPLTFDCMAEVLALNGQPDEALELIHSLTNSEKRGPASTSLFAPVVAQPGHGQLRFTEDLVSKPHVESCTSPPLTRGSAKLDDLGGVFIILASGGRSPSTVMGAQHRKELSITKSSLSFHQLRCQPSSLKTLGHPSRVVPCDE